MILRYFIPISVGNPAFSAHSFERVVDFVNQNNGEAFILVCDTLRILTNYMKRQRSPENAVLVANKSVADTVRMAQKIIEKKSSQKFSLSTIGDLEREDLFWAIKGRLFDLLVFDRKVYNHTEQIAKEKMKRLNISRTRRNIILEYGYIIEETSAAIYATEVIGYPLEIYISNGNGLIDYLQREHEAEIAKFLDKKKLDREFISWNDIGIDTYIAPPKPHQ